MPGELLPQIAAPLPHRLPSSSRPIEPPPLFGELPLPHACVRRPLSSLEPPFRLLPVELPLPPPALYGQQSLWRVSLGIPPAYWPVSQSPSAYTRTLRTNPPPTRRL